jgi:hypothetical protein
LKVNFQKPRRTLRRALSLVLCLTLIILPVFSGFSVYATIALPYNPEWYVNGSLWDYILEAGRASRGIEPGEFVDAFVTDDSNGFSGHSFGGRSGSFDFGGRSGSFADGDTPAPTADDLKRAYSEAVAATESGIGTTAVNKSGALLVNVPFDKYISTNATRNGYTGSNPYNYAASFPSAYGEKDHNFFAIETSPKNRASYYATITKNDKYVVAEYERMEAKLAYSYQLTIYVTYKTVAPVSGYYKIDNYFMPSGEYIHDDGTITGLSDNEKILNPAGEIIGAGRSMSYSMEYKTQYETVRFRVKHPRYIVFSVIPNESTVSQTTNDIVNAPQSRAGSLPINYSYTDNSGDTVTTENTTIVNEGDSTVYNPVTGDTNTFTDWTYDYSDRSYRLTMEGGDTTTVTYGDEYMTITEGDTTYTYNYITSNTSNVNGDNNNTNTGNGNTIIDTDGDGVPDGDSSGGDDSGNGNGNADGNNDGGSDDGGSDDGESPSLWDFIAGLFGSIGDLLGGVIKGIGEFLKPVVEALAGALSGLVDEVLKGLSAVSSILTGLLAEIPKWYEGFVKFLEVTFSFMPPEFTQIIIFGILVVVIAAIVKRLLG